MKSKMCKGLPLMITGFLLIAAALFLTIYNIYIDHKAGDDSNKIVSQIELAVSSDDRNSDIPDYLLNPYMEMPVITIDGIDYVGKITCPELGLNLPVISECSYPNLRIAPCRYSGSAYLDNMVIAGHNYSSLFGSLKNLSAGDKIIFTDADGNEFIYEVVETEVFIPVEVEEMLAGDWDLTLFTCTVGGRTRFTVRCERVYAD